MSNRESISRRDLLSMAWKIPAALTIIPVNEAVSRINPETPPQPQGEYRVIQWVSPFRRCNAIGFALLSFLATHTLTRRESILGILAAGSATLGINNIADAVYVEIPKAIAQSGNEHEVAKLWKERFPNEPARSTTAQRTDIELDCTRRKLVSAIKVSWAFGIAAVLPIANEFLDHMLEE